MSTICSGCNKCTECDEPASGCNCCQVCDCVAEDCEACGNCGGHDCSYCYGHECNSCECTEDHEEEEDPDEPVAATTEVVATGVEDNNFLDATFGTGNFFTDPPLPVPDGVHVYDWEGRHWWRTDGITGPAYLVERPMLVGLTARSKCAYASNAKHGSGGSKCGCIFDSSWVIIHHEEGEGGFNATFVSKGSQGFGYSCALHNQRHDGVR